jgi:hypothetical protein
MNVAASAVRGLDTLGSDPKLLGGDAESSAYDYSLYCEIDPGTRFELMLEQQVRRHHGKPPLDFNNLQAKIRDIEHDPSLDESGREARLEALRGQLELSEDTMRAFGTRRFAEATGRVAERLAADYEAILEELAASYEAVILRSGEDSLTARALAARMEEVSWMRDETLERLAAKQVAVLTRVVKGAMR